MRYVISTTNAFEKDVKRCVKRNYDLSVLKQVVVDLELNGKLQPRHKAHKLSGVYINMWECHLQSDWLLIWRQDDDSKEIELARTGTHSDLF